MARSEAKRQKRLAKQKAKRNEKKQDIQRAQPASTAERLARFESAPIVDCLINSAFERQGLANMMIGRKTPAGELVIAIFLVDPYCMGIKDAFARFTTPAEYRNLADQFRAMGTRPIDPPSFKRLIEDSLEYAQSLGLAPHGDFRRVRPILNGIDASLAREVFPMGKDGKPYFVAGPSQSPQDCRRIIAMLHRNFGPGGFHFMMPAEFLEGTEFEAGVARIDLAHLEE